MKLDPSFRWDDGSGAVVLKANESARKHETRLSAGFVWIPAFAGMTSGSHALRAWAVSHLILPSL